MGQIFLGFVLCMHYHGHLRPKVEAIIARGGGIEDPDAPGVLAETRFWDS